jgi:energy-converting hydrogenase Eha subunit H
LNLPAQKWAGIFFAQTLAFCLNIVYLCKTILNMESKAFKIGAEVTVTDLPEMQIKKQWVWVVTERTQTMMLPYELLSWQLRSLLKVKLHKAVKK